MVLKNILLSLVLVVSTCPMQISIKKPIIPKPELRHYRELSLKERCCFTGIRTFGRFFIVSFAQKAVNQVIRPPQDVCDWAERYYELCKEEIRAYAKGVLPEKIVESNICAQAIKTVIENAYIKGRSDLVCVLRDHYHHELASPAIIALAGAGYSKAVEILLQERPDDINARSLMHKTPLICAVRNGRLAMVELLLKKGADASLTDPCLCDALCHAQKRGYKHIEAILKNHQKEK